LVLQEFAGCNRQALLAPPTRNLVTAPLKKAKGSRKAAKEKYSAITKLYPNLNPNLNPHPLNLLSTKPGQLHSAFSKGETSPRELGLPFAYSLVNFLL
jgi:hypothetical protein